MDGTKLQELEQKCKQANAAYAAALDHWRIREQQLFREATQRIKEEQGDDFRAKQEAQLAADAAWRTERERVDVAAAMEKLPFPEGTVLVEWLPHTDNESRYRKTGTKSVLQILRSGDPSPDNRRYNPIPNGSFIVRLLTVGGKPGKRYEQYVKHLWLKEGEVHPNCVMSPCPSCGKPRPADGVKRDRFAPGSVCPNCGHVAQTGTE